MALALTPNWLRPAAAIMVLLWSLPVVWGQTDALVDLSQRAESLEKKGHWLEAADLYATLARRQPGVPAWQERARLCRRHDQLSRRYRDPSFQNKVLTLTLERALQVYDEVLGKIQAHYVNETTARPLVDRGLDQLDLALQNAAFVKAAFAVTPSDSVLAQTRAALPERWRPVLAGARRDAVQRVQTIAVALQQDIGVNATAVVMEFVCAACEGLDDYSSYLCPDRFALEKTLAQTDLAGIGVELQLSHGHLVIGHVAADSPAARAGIQVNDHLLEIDDMSAAEQSPEEATLRLLGRDGSTVSVVVQGAFDLIPRRAVMTRQPRSLPSIDDARLVDADMGIGYVHIAVFQKSTADEFDAAMNRLAMQGLRALILDLRGNPGGHFDAAVQVADRILLEGVIVSTKGRSFGTTSVRRTQDERSVMVPIVVLIDGGTASAAEVVAGALRDHRRATLVGEVTYGKGSLQHVFPLRSVPSGIRLTTAKYYTPLDHTFDQPIAPDIVVDRLPGMMESMESMMFLLQLQRLQFEEALRVAREQITKS